LLQRNLPIIFPKNGFKNFFGGSKDIRLFDSLAKNEESGLSNIDIFIMAKHKRQTP